MTIYTVHCALLVEIRTTTFLHFGKFTCSGRFRQSSGYQKNTEPQTIYLSCVFNLSFWYNTAMKLRLNSSVYAKPTLRY